MATQVVWLQHLTWAGVDYHPGDSSLVDDMDVGRLVRSHYAKVATLPLPPISPADPFPQYQLDSERGPASLQVLTYTVPQTATPVALPAGAVAYRFRCLGAPGAGGSGRRGAADTLATGGGGGGGGGYTETLVPASDLVGVTEVFVSVGGTSVGGVAVAADNTNGNPGTPPVAHNVKSVVALTATAAPTVAQGLCVAERGAQGQGGTAVGAAAGGPATVSLGNGSSGSASSATGGAGIGGTHVGAGGGGPGGGSGGGITVGNVASAGGAGSWPPGFGGTSPAAGAIGAAGASGTNPVPMAASQGGAGGGSSLVAAGGAGGNGGRGAGGGGGGASRNGNASGKGGDGGPAFVQIIAYF